jgi:hypothetical protein
VITSGWLHKLTQKNSTPLGVKVAEIVASFALFIDGERSRLKKMRKNLDYIFTHFLSSVLSTVLGEISTPA